jgi:5-methylcytosine-specific restriction endonuclease McrA
MAPHTTALSDLSDDQLLVEVHRLAAAERCATVVLIRSLIELDARPHLYLREGCSSLFVYCTRILHLAEGSTYNRIEVARAARRFPIVLDALEEGALTLTGARLLAPHLTEENCHDVLAAARHQSKSDVERLVASRAAVAPLSTERYKVELTISGETREKLRRVQDLLRHAVPNGDLAEIFDRALTALLEDVERRRCAATSRPRAHRKPTSDSRHIPAAVRREVWKRDQGRCAFVGRSGRCGETSFLEFHHVEPHAAGGSSTVDNIQLRCRAHNLYEARLFFGSELPQFVRKSAVQWFV